MANDHVKLQIVKENYKDSDKHVDDEIEMIFGKPAPAPTGHVTNNVPMFVNERAHSKHFVSLFVSIYLKTKEN